MTRSGISAAAASVAALVALLGAGAANVPAAVDLVPGAAPDAPPAAVEARGLGNAVLRGLAGRAPDDPAWTAALSLHVDAGRGTLPPVLARYELRGDVVRLTPRFPLEPGVAYRARAGGVERTFEAPRRAAARTTRVVAIHPAAPRVPANLLRWYVELSAPMEPGRALEHVRLLDEAGREVPDAFLRLDEELWDPARRRLTLLLDPGRVKRGIRTNVEAGAPLVAGRRYKLVIDPGWPDGRGAPLASGLEHEFEAGPDDRRAPDVARWRVESPGAGTRAPLVVEFGEPLDHALAARLLAVHDAAGRPVHGAATLAPGDAAWRFVPDAPWAAGAYALRARATLEDVAGNSLARVFDADRRAADRTAEESDAEGAWRERRFTVRAAPALATAP